MQNKTTHTNRGLCVYVCECASECESECESECVSVCVPGELFMQIVGFRRVELDPQVKTVRRSDCQRGKGGERERERRDEEQNTITDSTNTPETRGQ